MYSAYMVTPNWKLPGPLIDSTMSIQNFGFRKVGGGRDVAKFIVRIRYPKVENYGRPIHTIYIHRATSEAQNRGVEFIARMRYAYSIGFRVPYTHKQSPRRILRIESGRP